MTAVLIMAKPPTPGQVRRGLERTLGPAGCAALEAELLRATAEWARAVAPDAVYVGFEPPSDWISCDVQDAQDKIRALVGSDAKMFAHEVEGTGPRVIEGVELVLEQESSPASTPVLVVWPELPRLGPDHAEAALGDLDAGCELTFGPVIGGGFYLLGMAGPDPRLAQLPESAWHAPDVIATLAVTLGSSAEVGILATERGLRDPTDLDAVRADPTLRGLFKTY